MPNSSELSSIDVPTKSKDRHFSERESASSCKRLMTACKTEKLEIKLQSTAKGIEELASSRS